MKIKILIEWIFGFLFMLAGLSAPLQSGSDNLFNTIVSFVLCELIGIGLFLCAYKNTKKSKKPELKSTDKFTNSMPSSIHSFSPLFPDTVNNIPRAYVYSGLQINEPNLKLIESLLYKGIYNISAIKNKENIELYSGDEFVGFFDENKKDMLMDWISRDDPFVIYLSDTSIPSLRIAFYKDKQKDLSWRNHEVVKLISYAGEDAQQAASSAFNGEEIVLDDDGETIFAGDLGKLPSSAGKKYLECGAAGCFIDHIDYDNEKDKYIPYVVIYW